MNDGDGLLRSILEAPGEDTPRLVYADWLDELGAEGPCPHCGGGRSGSWHFELDDEGRCATCGRRGISPGRLVPDPTLKAHAEFIRVQIEYARQPGADQCAQCYNAHFGQQRTNGPCRCSVRVKELRRREYELWQGDLLTVYWNLPPLSAPNARAWHATTRRDSQAGPPVAVLERGFVEHIALPCAAFLEHAEAIFRAHPVTRVVLTGREPDLEDLDRNNQNRIWVREIRDPLDWAESILPVELFDLLPGDKTGGIWTAPTEADALKALSDVAVTYGRSLAELSPLPASSGATLT